MKGTIDSSVPDAKKVLLNDEKEEAEHNTIVDLIRNDLSKVTDNVVVTRYRYIDRIKSGRSELLQVSSEISGKLINDYENNLGDIIAGLLPADSVTGAPKNETVRIIKESENFERGWYTGVFGVFDGKSLDSAAMIRFIEKDSDNFFYLNALLTRETGATVLHASNGREAIELFKANPGIILILMDIKMPEIDGLEATKQIKLIKKEVLVIAITAYAMSGDEEKVLAAGCDGYLSKPISKKNLLGKMAEFM